MRMEGELMLLDGKVYRLLPDSKIEEASSEEQVPFAMAVNFSPDYSRDHIKVSKGSLEDICAEMVPNTNNNFVSYRIKGHFPSITVRTVYGQEYDGQPLSELSDHQYVYDYTDVWGTIIGFRSPQSWQGLTVAGHHLHFISDDHAIGGHVLSMETDDAQMGIAVTSNMHVELPTSTEFNNANLSAADRDIRKVEG